MILYIIQVIIYTALMLAIYRLFLYNNNAHRFSRYYLLASALLPILLPALKMPALLSGTASNMAIYRLPEFTVTNARVENSLQIATIILIGIYVAGLIIAGLVFLLRYAKLKKLINNSEHESREGYVLVKNSGYGPASWNRYILLPEESTDETIIHHERAHIRMYHTADMVVLSILQVVFWPNVFLWLVKKELVMVHEFQADEAAGSQTKDYTQLLLASVFGKCTLPYTHSFITHPIKRRIIMLQKAKKYTGLRSVLAVLMLLLVTGTIVSIQSCESKNWTVEENEEAVQAVPEKDVLTYTHKMPEADYNVFKELGKITVYPKEAMEKGIEGRIVVSFVVDKDGRITNVKAPQKDKDPLLRQAAIDAVSKLPDWQPGEDVDGNKVAVQYYLPIVFKLPKSDEEVALKNIPSQVLALVYKPDVNFEITASKADKNSPEHLRGKAFRAIMDKRNVRLK